MELRGYQEDAIKEIDQVFKESNKVVLSICPSGGKTTTAIQYAMRNNLKTLILAHGTSVLRSQWGEALEKHGVKWSDDFTEQFTVNLPQSIKSRKEFTDIDLLIVDEAHEFYLAKGMVNSIIKHSKPKKIMLLTGTPSKFIKRGYPIVLIAAEELIKEDYINNVYFGLASTTEDLKKSDYTVDNNVSGKFVFKHTLKTLDNLMRAIHTRLNETLFKENPHLSMNIPTMFSNLNKTMIACNNTVQADQVLEYFKANNVGVISSHYANDIHSENIQSFLEDKNIKILVVVNRGILGFNMPELVNVVDMTCTKNIDRIYQLYARVMRKHKNYKIKYYFKVVPEIERELYKFYLSAALCLLNKDFIAMYNGKNLKGMEIPIIRDKTIAVGTTGSKGNRKTKPISNIIPVDGFFRGQVTSTELLINIYNKSGKYYNEFAYTTIKDIQKGSFAVSEIEYNTVRETEAMQEEYKLHCVDNKCTKNENDNDFVTRFKDYLNM